MIVLLVPLCLLPALAVMAVGSLRRPIQRVSPFDIFAKMQAEKLAAECGRRRMEVAVSILTTGRLP